MARNNPDNPFTIDQLIAVALAVGEYWFYRSETQAIRSQENKNLKAIASFVCGFFGREDLLLNRPPVK